MNKDRIALLTVAIAAAAFGVAQHVFADTTKSPTDYSLTSGSIGPANNTVSTVWIVDSAGYLRFCWAGNGAHNGPVDCSERHDVKK